LVEAVTDFECGGASPNNGSANTLDGANAAIKAADERHAASDA
jgi:hypothetical protein